MSRTLDTLLRMNRWQLDEQRRTIKELAEMKAETEARLLRLETELNREATEAQSVESRLTFASFLAQAIERKRTLARSLEEIEERLASAHEGLNESYREIKKYERLLDDQKNRLKAQREKAEALSQDELTLARYQRLPRG